MENLIFTNKYNLKLNKTVNMIKEKFKLEDGYKTKKNGYLIELINTDMDVFIKRKNIHVVVFDESNQELIREIKNYFYKEISEPLSYKIVKAIKDFYDKATFSAGHITIWILIIIMIGGGKITIDSNIIRWIGKILNLD